VIHPVTHRNHHQDRRTLGQPSFRQRLRQAAELIEMLWPTDHEEEGSPRERARRKRAFGLYTAVLQASEEAAVTRARLTSRPHPPTRTAQLRGLLARQSARRDATYQALSKLLEAQLAAESQCSSSAAGRASFLCS
jgi:hypothetical protein